MKKLFFTLLIALSGLTVSAQTQKSLLWKVVSPQGAESHLFGTYHLLGGDYLEENQKVKLAWQNAETVVVELVVDSTKMMEVMMAGMMPGKSLKELVSKEDYQMLKQKLEPVIGMDLAMADQMKPLTLSLAYAMSIASQQTPDTFFFEGDPIDLFLAQKLTEGQKIFPLESMMEQMDILYGSETVEEQARDLVEMVKNEQESTKSTQRVLQAYMAQDLDQMLVIATEFEEAYGDLDVLLDERNIKWVDKLIPLLNEGKAFVAVGALHLPGENGLINLLKAKGYQLKPVLKAK